MWREGKGVKPDIVLVAFPIVCKEIVVVVVVVVRGD